MLDVRLAIGGLFTIIGVLLIAHGVAVPVATEFPFNGQTISVNLNRDWGAVIFVFGALMLLLVRLENRAKKSGDDT